MSRSFMSVLLVGNLFLLMVVNFVRGFMRRSGR